MTVLIQKLEISLNHIKEDVNTSYILWQTNAKQEE